MTEAAAFVSGLFVYPLKSAAGIALERARVGPRGIEHDRRFMVVDKHGVFVTQRTHPRLALVHVRLAGGTVTLGAPGAPEIALPPVVGSGSPRTVRVWDDSVAAHSAGAEAAAWMSGHLGIRCDIVSIPDDAHRTVKPEFAPRRAISFADAFPFLLLSVGALADLNARLAAPLPMDRFRPNIVVAGCPAYAEDSWRRLRIGALRMAVAKPCSRCAVTTVDQRTGEPGREPLATLATYRRAGNKVYFGQNLIHEDEGELAVGDPVQALATA